MPSMRRVSVDNALPAGRPHNPAATRPPSSSPVQTSHETQQSLSTSKSSTALSCSTTAHAQCNDMLEGINSCSMCCANKGAACLLEWS